MQKSAIRRLGTRVKQTIEDLNQHWTPIGAIFIIAGVMTSVLANVAQILSTFPADVTVPISLPALALAAIAGLAAFITIAVQLSTNPDVLIKRAGITPLTNILVDRRRGELYFGEIRNVLMRIETIREVLYSVAAFSENTEQTRKRLFKIGKQIGKDFADDFHDVSNVARESQKLTDMIDLWCEYDVEAGWGKFNFEPGPMSNSGTIDSGTIVVRSNFLISPLDGDTHESLRFHPESSLCSFLEGYVSGVLEVFMRTLEPKNDWKANVSERVCGLTKARGSCRFVFNIERVTRADDLA